jgi:hypothetical protein
MYIISSGIGSKYPKGLIKDNFPEYIVNLNKCNVHIKKENMYRRGKR